MWKVGKLFGGIPINCAEFTPFDNIELDIFKHDFVPTPGCKAADPGNTQFCQVCDGLCACLLLGHVTLFARTHSWLVSPRACVVTRHITLYRDTLLASITTCCRIV